MHYFTVDEVVKGAKLKKMNIDEVTGTMLYLLNKGYVKGMRQLGIAYPTSIYITETGIDFLENKKPQSIKKSNSFLSKKVIPIVVAIIVAIAGIGGGAYYFSLNQNNESYIITDSDNAQIFSRIGNLQIIQTPIQKETLKDGEQGNLYVDTNAGFIIEKPSTNWYFMKVADYVEKINIEQGDDFLGGIFVATDKPGNVMVVVQKLHDPINFDLSKYIDRQITEGSKNVLNKEGTLTKKFVSPDGKWASFEGYVDLNVHEYARQILHKYDDKLYLIQTSSDSPEIIPDETKIELKTIVESFRIID